MVLIVLPVSTQLRAQSSDYVESGFLEDYSILNPDPERPSVRMYKAPGVDFSDYDSVLLVDIPLFLHPDSEYKGISARKIFEITAGIQIYLEDILRERRELVTNKGQFQRKIESGENVLVIRAAITNVYAKRPQRGESGYTPIGIARTGIQKAVGSDYVLSTSAVEAEVLDGQTGEMIASLVATNVGETFDKGKSGELKWSDIESGLREYANTLRDQFN